MDASIWTIFMDSICLVPRPHTGKLRKGSGSACKVQIHHANQECAKSSVKWWFAVDKALDVARGRISGKLIVGKAVKAFTFTFVCIPASYGKSFHGCLSQHSTVYSHHSQDSASLPHTKHRTDTAPWSNEAKTDIYIYVYIYIVQMYTLGCVHFTQMCKINTWFWDTAIYYVLPDPFSIFWDSGSKIIMYMWLCPTVTLKS